MKLQINYLAVLVCVILHAALGALWFTALFGDSWAQMNGITAAQMQMGAGAMPYVYNLFNALFMALLLAWLIGRLKIGSPADGARLGLTIAVSVGLFALITTYSFAGKPMKLALIDGFYGVVSMTIMGVVLTTWKTKAQKVAALAT